MKVEQRSLLVGRNVVEAGEELCARISAGGEGGRKQTTRPHKRQWCRRVFRPKLARHIGHRVASESSCHLTIPCSARSSSDLLPATVLQRSLAVFPRREPESSDMEDSLDSRTGGVGSDVGSAGGGKCKATSFSIRRPSLPSSNFLPSLLDFLFPANSSVLSLLTPCGWNPLR